MGLKWHNFADDNDQKAVNFFTQLTAEKMNGTGWQDTWLELPADLYLSFSRGTHAQEPGKLWDGFEWRTVMYYISSHELLYVRLPADGEIRTVTETIEREIVI